MDFFGLATLSGNLYLDSDGNFDLGLSGRMVLGSDDYGLVGEFSIRITSLTRDDGTYRFELSGSARVKVRAFGITLAGVGLAFSFHVDTAEVDSTGRVKIELSIRVEVEFLFFTISGTVNITLGYLQLPPPVYMASDGVFDGVYYRTWDNSDTTARPDPLPQRRRPGGLAQHRRRGPERVHDHRADRWVRRRRHDQGHRLRPEQRLPARRGHRGPLR